MRIRFLTLAPAVLVVASGGCKTGYDPSYGGGDGGGSYSRGGSDLDVLEGASIVAHDGTFLGIISNNSYNSDSITNKFGSYGNKFSSTSIFNQYGTYGGQYSDLSPFNRYAGHPPEIVLQGQREYSYLTVNTSITPRIDPYAVLAYFHGT